MENQPADLLEPDILLSHGYWENFCGKTSLCPEKMLMLAVLEDAVDSIRKGARTSGSLEFHEAADWILEEKTDWPFSFENICAALGLEADYICEGLLDWSGKKVVKMKPRPRKESSNSPRLKPGPTKCHFTAHLPEFYIAANSDPPGSSLLLGK